MGNQNLKTALASTNYTKLDKLIQNADNFKDFMNRLHNGNNKLVSMQHTARKSQKTKPQMDSVAKSTNDISKKRKRTTSSGSSSRSSSTLKGEKMMSILLPEDHQGSRREMALQ